MTQEMNVIIVGAGKAGAILQTELKQPRYRHYNVIGFIDDDERLKGSKIGDIDVLGDTNQIPEVVEKYSVDLTIIAIPSAPGKTISRILDIIYSTSSSFMIVPPIFENLKINAISSPRQISVDDLIRAPIENVLTESSMQELSDYTILITGAAGSIGSEICFQLAGCSPKKIIGLDAAETPLFELANNMEYNYENIKFTPILANIRDSEKLREVIKEHKPDIVYHCAAFKHVGMMEAFPYECVKNNIQGSTNLIQIVSEEKIERFVFVSTDKAVNPVNVMGSSKRIIEKYILNLKSNHTKFMIVRFGNVLESQGSAIPIFKKQIETGGPVLLTDKRMERYFMTLTEAAQLVIQASILGKGGELCVLEMGEPYMMIDIIHRLFQIYGYEKDDIKIKEIGIRPGEKITEELFHSFEKQVLSQHDRIFICEMNNDMISKDFNEQVQAFILDADSMTNDEIKKKIQELVED
ncbi:MAG: SDR family NAD(P)-dependent oxidoreductase [Candidatus Heimdallarchaeaceae archaeon]